MANYCMLCGKKIGFFMNSVEDFLTNNPENKICGDCDKLTDIILKKIEHQIPLEESDFEAFTPEGRAYIESHIIGADDVMTIEVEEEIKPENVMELEVGDSITHKIQSISEEETEEILKEIESYTFSQIEEYLDGLISQNQSPGEFMEEITNLSDEELSSILADQREYYNNAEWAYIRLVSNRRNDLENAQMQKKKASIPVCENEEDINYGEINRMMEVFQDKEKSELEEIYADDSYTYEARIAAQKLINQKN